jgi:acetyl-CoA carboxylase biotin carboxyl carrier protein
MDEHSQSIQSFINLLKQHNLAELEFEREGFRIRLKRESAVGTTIGAKSDTMIGGTPSQPESQAVSVSENTAGMVTITSPIVGTFYRSPSPDADPYVEEGDVVKKGQVLCIVEAMKLMNEIESELHGRVVKILAESTKALRGLHRGMPPCQGANPEQKREYGVVVVDLQRPLGERTVLSFA